VIYDLIEITFA